MKKYINQFVYDALQKKLITEKDVDASFQCLSKMFKEPMLEKEIKDYGISIEDCLNHLMKKADEIKLISSMSVDEQDAFEALLYNCVMPSPKKVKEVCALYMKKDPHEAASYLYQLSKDVNYIKTMRLHQNHSWIYEGTYGQLHMTINLSKPEKDPREIAKAKDLQAKKDMFIPKCVLCKENEQNYFNARMNLRMIPIELGHELWHFQFSPYSYYNEHAIVLHDQHRPMKICEKTFGYLLDFIDLFPKYFIGSNADLPIVGGSILNHDHFQAGMHHFPIENAKVLQVFETLNDCNIKHIEWPLSTIRLSSTSKERLIKVAVHFLEQWKHYSSEDLNILSFTDDESHNTITPIARKVGNLYEMDLILRNNRTTEKHPLGLFHPHEQYHHIKKENIGLIEAMGLAILPGRLKIELEGIKNWLTSDGDIRDDLMKHKSWMLELKKKYTRGHDNDVLYKEVGHVFESILLDCGVFKLDEKGMKGMHQFIKQTIDRFTYE